MSVDDDISTLAAAKDLLQKPWVVALLAVVLVTAVVAVVLALYIARKRSRAAWGPYGAVVQFVLAGHAEGVKENKEAAADLYRTALLKLCRKVLNSGRGSKNGSSSIVSAAPAAVAKDIDETLHTYNGAVGLGAVLAFAVRNEALAGADTIFPVAFDGDGAGVMLDSSRCIHSLTPGGASACAGTAIGDRLVSVNGTPTAELGDEQIRAQLDTAGRCSFQRPTTCSMALPKGGESSADAVFVCSRCGSGNRPSDEPCKFFRCYSCQATAVSWQFLFTAPASGTSQQQPRWAKGRVGPDMGYEHLKDLTWEASGLDKATKHPTGFGTPMDTPEGCQHHGQVGAMCGMAAVNNLLTNAGKSIVDAQYMLQVSTRLSEAEAVLREGAQTVQEAGEDVNVAEFYVASTGGHFDVQTLQTVFAEAGYNMWYVAPQQLHKPDTLFAGRGSDSAGDVVGYVVHRRDPLNPRQDHWLVVRQHGKGPGAQFFMQDSLYDQVFLLTQVEAHQLLLNLPAGSLFAVSLLPATAEP